MSSAAVRDPRHRPARAAGQERQQHLLGVGPRLRPEAAAHVLGDHPHRRRFEAVGAGQRVADGMGALAGRVVHQPAVRPTTRRPTRGSRGQGATRLLTMRSATTTSQRVEVGRQVGGLEVDGPVAGRGARRRAAGASGAAAASGSTTTGSGS